ncbi:MAG TPA: hypothetical protein VGL86_05250 [Polyangia bacterium]|jgi:hypothetical protein
MHTIGPEVLMVRMMSFLLSFWLTLLFVVATGAHIPKLMVFFVGLGGVVALFGAFVSPVVSAGWRLAGSLVLSIGMFVLGAIGLAMKVPPWLPWCLFMGTFCFIGVTIAELLWAPRNRGTMAPADS